jgi:hypothetical protein
MHVNTLAAGMQGFARQGHPAGPGFYGAPPDGKRGRQQQQQQRGWGGHLPPPFEGDSPHHRGSNGMPHGYGSPEGATFANIPSSSSSESLTTCVQAQKSLPSLACGALRSCV